MPARKVSLDKKTSESAKKPSLSALMPDKTPKAVAERNRAVKRMFKDAPSPAKKVARSKLVSKKPVAVKSEKKISKKPVARVQVRSKAKNSLIIQSNIAAKESITLPDRVSMRSQEKVLAILSTLSKDFRHSAQKVSYVAGFCFVAFGSYMALSFSGALPDILTPQFAQVISGTSSSASTLSNTIQATKPLQLKPMFSLLDPLPPVLDGVSKHTIEIANASLTDARVYSLATGETYDVGAEKVVDNTYRLTLDPNSLPSARYVLKVTVESSADSSKYVFKVGEYEVKPPATDVPTQATTTESTKTPETFNDESDQVEESDPVKEEVEELEEKPEALTITTPGTVLSNRTVITVTAPSAARSIELYVRPLKSSTKRFIGLAERYADSWQYFFDTRNVPNGEYEIVARTKINNIFNETSSPKIKIANFTGSPTTPENPTPNEVAPIEPELEIDPQNGRSFSEVSLYSVATEAATDAGSATGTVLSSDSVSDVDTVVAFYRTDLEDILKRYAVAKQSEDVLMLELVENEMKRVKANMVNDVLLNPNLNELGDDIDTALDERLATIKRRIDTFEELRRTATERASAADRDGDGISDFDEINLYQSDPDKSDTDNDGVTDGIEIMRGFDPLDPVAEVVVSYEMPMDTVGLIEDTLLKVENVTPVIKTDDPTVAPTVQAEIRGKGLPNSFVTIYVFSTPTIVTVRTGEDGSFVYTFEKELEDGEHEVYVAVTDNSGAIMARSNPFRFIKEAEAFSPIGGAATVQTNNSLTGIQIFGTFNVAVGLGILAFGMILLMLGATLRERQGFLMTSPKNDIAAS